MIVKQHTNSRSSPEVYINSGGKCWAIESGEEGRAKYKDLKGVAQRVTSGGFLWAEDPAYHKNITTVIPQEYMEFT